jgi:hypothetical protein
MALATEDRLAAFRTSIAPDFYTPEEFILWGEVEAILNRLKPAIEVLQELSTLPDASEESAVFRGQGLATARLGRLEGRLIARSPL